MALSLADKWVWDFWFARDGETFHIFYLQADRALKEEHLRHWHVSIGHAKSTDLINWTILPDAIRPAPDAEAFDSYTTWTGSVIRHDGLWYMFYTGGKRSEDALVQRVGAATSADLITWQKLAENPLIEADPRWYELLDLDAWHDQAWRDPWVFRGEDGAFHALMTARSKDGAPDARGVIGHARSADLKRWEVLPPLVACDDFGYLEVPQVEQIGGRYYLLFSCPRPYYSEARKARTSTRAHIHYLVGDSALGPFRYEGGVLQTDHDAPLYSGKLIQGADGVWYLMGFHDTDSAGTFHGVISDPIPVSVDDAGRLVCK